MRDLIIAAIQAELWRQADDPEIVGVFNGSVESLADAIVSALGETSPFEAMLALTERMAAIADQMESAMTVEVEHPGELILETPTLTADQLARLKAEIEAWKKKGGPVLLEGGIRVRGAIRSPIESSGPLHEVSTWAYPPDPDAKVEFVKPEPPIEITATEREALKRLRAKPCGVLFSNASDVETGDGVSYGALRTRGLVERSDVSNTTNWRFGWTVTPLGLRAIEQEPL